MAKKSTRKCNSNAIVKEFKTQVVDENDQRFEEMKSQLRPDLRRGLKEFILIKTDDDGNAIPKDDAED